MASNGTGASPIKKSSNKMLPAVLAVAAVALGAGGFLIWKKHHATAAFQPPMSVSTIPSGGSRPAEPHRPAHGAMTPSLASAPVAVPGNGSFVNATPPQAQIQAPPAAAPSPAVVQQSIEAQNQSYYSNTANLRRALSIVKLQYEIASVQSKINRLNNGGDSSSNLPPPPSAGPPAPGPSSSKLVQSLTVPEVSPASRSRVLSVADGRGGDVAVIEFGGGQYTVHKGDWVGGLQVTSVTSRHVILSGHGQHHNLVFNQ